MSVRSTLRLWGAMAAIQWQRMSWTERAVGAAIPVIVLGWGAFVLQGRAICPESVGLEDALRANNNQIEQAMSGSPADLCTAYRHRFEILTALDACGVTQANASRRQSRTSYVETTFYQHLVEQCAAPH